MKKKSSFTFSSIPKINIPRSKFDMSHSVKTTINQGEITPVYLQEVYPGDSFKVQSTYITRTASSLIRPIMDNLFLDTYYFFVPSRLVYDKWAQIFGENASGPWAETEFAEAPGNGTYSASLGNVNSIVGGVADHLGLPITMLVDSEGYLQTPFKTFSTIPFRCFAKVYDDWFRDENVVGPMNIRTSDNTSTSFGMEYINNKEWSINNYFGKLPKVSKLHDYFTSALPSPQKGSPVTFNITNGYVPVIPLNNMNNNSLLNAFNSPALSFAKKIGSSWSDSTANGPLSLLNGNLINSGSGASSGTQVVPNNLAGVIDHLTAFSVNDMRFAFQLQKMLERDARGGTRFTEYIENHFNVLNPDSRLQRAEYLGGKRSPLNITQVTQTTGSSTTPSNNSLGDLGGYSLTGSNTGFKKSFTEHGFVIGVACIRQFHTYQQGFDKFWFRFKRTDFYDPVFANIGEQPIYSKEIYASTTNISANNVFGYNEAWADLRYNNSKISGFMRSGIQDSYDVWHLGDYYANSPTYSQSFVEEGDNVKQVLSVQEGPNFLVDIFHKVSAIRPLPLYSVPGLLDHH